MYMLIPTTMLTIWLNFGAEEDDRKGIRLRDIWQITAEAEIFHFAYLPRRNCRRCKQRQLTMMIRRNTICMSPLTWRRRVQRWTLECIQRKNVPRQLSLLSAQWQLVGSLGILAPLLCLWKEKKKRIKIKTSRRSFFLNFTSSHRHSIPVTGARSKIETVSNIWNAICFVELLRGFHCTRKSNGIKHNL